MIAYSACNVVQEEASLIGCDVLIRSGQGITAEICLNERVQTVEVSLGEHDELWVSETVLLSSEIVIFRLVLFNDIMHICKNFIHGDLVVREDSISVT